jgi:hypothetical protein
LTSDSRGKALFTQSERLDRTQDIRPTFLSGEAHLLTPSRRIVLLLALAEVASCNSWMKTSEDVANDEKRAHELNMAKQLCSPAALVGTTSGFKIAFDAKREQLTSARGNLTAERYSKLSQELTGYSVQWEAANQQVKIACNQYAVCLARDSDTGPCSGSEDRYQEKIKTANTLTGQVRAIDVP